MKIAIMQPYFFPYIGYFQLINEIDNFIILDDVNYINKGWIDRNKILINGSEFYFKIPLEKKSQNQKINQLKIVSDNSWKIKLIKTLYQTYKKKEHFKKTFTTIEKIILNDENNLNNYLMNSLKQTLSLLEIHTNIFLSSKFNHENLNGEERIIQLCNKLNAKEYYNLIGGQSLYNKDNFNKYSINLNFIKPLSNISENYSIIHLIFNDFEKIKFYLKNFKKF